MRMVRFLIAVGLALVVSSVGGPRPASAALTCTFEGTEYVATITGAGPITGTGVSR
jgi:hypothetical protein